MTDDFTNETTPKMLHAVCASLTPVTMFKASRMYMAFHLPVILTGAHLPSKGYRPRLRKLFNSPSARGYDHGIRPLVPRCSQSHNFREHLQKGEDLRPLDSLENMGLVYIGRLKDLGPVAC